jgi:hypothetical protein
MTNDEARDPAASLGSVAKTKCQTERDAWDCENMREIEGNTSMTHEYYACTVCGRRMSLDYDEMR